MLKKTMIIVAGLALGSTVLQTQAFAAEHGGGRGGDFGEHSGGFGHPDGHRGHFSRGDSFVDDGNWPYYGDDDYCYWTRWHGHYRQVCE